jgi:hypothetical protein
VCKLPAVWRVLLTFALCSGCATTPTRTPFFNDAQYLRFGVDPRTEADTLVRNYADQAERLALRVIGRDFTALGFMDRSGRATRARIVTLRGIALALDPEPEIPLRAPSRYALLAPPLPDTQDPDRDGFEEVFIEQRSPARTCLLVFRVRDVGYVDRVETRLHAFNQDHCATGAADFDQDGRIELYVDVQLLDFELPHPPTLRLLLWADQHRFSPAGVGDQLARFVASQQAAREIDLDQARASKDSVNARRLAVELAALTQVLGLPEQDQLAQFDRALGHIPMNAAEKAWSQAARAHIAQTWKTQPALVAPEPAPTPKPDANPSGKRTPPDGLAERDPS